MARSRFEIATFNLYNLNRPGHRIYSDLDGWSDEQYAAKRDWTAGVLQRVNADAYGFQELWHGQALSDVFEAAGLSADYDLLIPENHEGQRIACAGAVRKGLLVGEPEWIEDFPENFQLSANGDDPQTPRVEVTLNAFSRPVLHYRIQPRQGIFFEQFIVLFQQCIGKADTTQAQIFAQHELHPVLPVDSEL